jgi:hypothetical protein
VGVREEQNQSLRGSASRNERAKNGVFLCLGWYRSNTISSFWVSFLFSSDFGLLFQLQFFCCSDLDWLIFFFFFLFLASFIDFQTPQFAPNFTWQFASFGCRFSCSLLQCSCCISANVFDLSECSFKCSFRRVFPR